MACATTACAVARADETRPFEFTDQSPLVQVFGLPAIGPARVLDAGATTLRFSADLANHYAYAASGGERILIDAETRRFTVALRRGARDGIEWGLELPYVGYSGGAADALIERWHALGGFPNGGREFAPRNRLWIEYLRNGVPILLVRDAGDGLGDLRLDAARRLASGAADSASDLALRGALKLPTGDATGLRGSGATDAALWLSAACDARRCSGELGWYAGAGLLRAGPGVILAAQQRRLIPFGSAGLAWRVTPALVLRAQVDAHGSFYRDSDLKPLGAALQGLFGGSWMIGARRTLDFALAEDLRVGSVPDVQFHLAWRLNY